MLKLLEKGKTIINRRKHDWPDRRFQEILFHRISFLRFLSGWLCAGQHPGSA
jgi:hypothetical protein